MDYEVMLDFHKANNADVTIAAMPVPMEEASRFGIVVTDQDSRIKGLKRSLRSQAVIWHRWESISSAGRFLKRHSSS